MDFFQKIRIKNIFKISLNKLKNKDLIFINGIGALSNKKYPLIFKN